MMIGELEAYWVILGNCIYLLPQVILLVQRSELEMSIAVSVMCLTRL